jgi:hypothetical protein
VDAGGDAVVHMCGMGGDAHADMCGGACVVVRAPGSGRPTATTRLHMSE